MTLDQNNLLLILQEMLVLLRKLVEQQTPRSINTDTSSPVTLLTKQEVKELLNISESTYKRQVAKALLKPMNLGGGDVFYRNDLDDALWESKRKGRT